MRPGRKVRQWTWKKRSNILCRTRTTLLQLRRINESANSGNPIDGNTYSAGMFPDTVLIWREVNAVNLVLGHIAVEPLYLRPHFLQCLQGAQRYFTDLVFCQRSGAGYFTFDHELGHGGSLAPTQLSSKGHQQFRLRKSSLCLVADASARKSGKSTVVTPEAVAMSLIIVSNPL